MNKGYVSGYNKAATDFEVEHSNHIIKWESSMDYGKGIKKVEFTLDTYEKMLFNFPVDTILKGSDGI